MSSPPVLAPPMLYLPVFDHPDGSGQSAVV